MFLFTVIVAMLLLNDTFAQNGTNIILSSSLMVTPDRWRIVNDGVMGGLSSSTVSVNGSKNIVFRGSVSLDNNGGFASLRSPVKNYNFQGFSGVEIRMKTEGKLYSISMKETSYFSGYFYTASFETKKDEWMVFKIPFGNFKLFYFGKETDSAKKIPLDNIKEISLLIGEKQEGSFETEIDYIKLY